MPVIDPRNILASVGTAEPEAQSSLITAIQPSKRSRDRMHIYVDGGYALTLSIDVISEARLRVGMELPIRKVDELVEQERFQRLYDRAINYLASRPLSEYELSSKLREVQRKAARPKPKKKSSFKRSAGFGSKRKPMVLHNEDEDEDETLAADLPEQEDEPEDTEAADPELIDRVLDKLRERSYVDDLAFARFWIGNREQFKPMGERMLRSELRGKRVADYIIQQALDEQEAAAEEERKSQRELAAAAQPLTRRPVRSNEDLSLFDSAPDEQESASEDDEGYTEDFGRGEAGGERSKALEAARKKLRSYQNLDRLTFKRRMGGFLQRRGFGFGTVSYVTNRLWAELNGEASEDDEVDEE
jgi:SOS response regulatory protein OraA/RecX